MGLITGARSYRVFKEIARWQVARSPREPSLAAIAATTVQTEGTEPEQRDSDSQRAGHMSAAGPVHWD